MLIPDEAINKLTDANTAMSLCKCLAARSRFETIADANQPKDRDDKVPNWNSRIC